MNYIETTLLDTALATLRVESQKVTGMLNKQITKDFMILVETSYNQFKAGMLDYNEAKDIFNDVADEIIYFLEEQDDDDSRKIWK